MTTHTKRDPVTSMANDKSGQAKEQVVDALHRMAA